MIENKKIIILTFYFSLMYKNILISGGNGFLGSHIAEKAISENYEVTVVDDLSTSKGINVPEKVNFVQEKIEK
ncbi:MAG: NAD-dependent epimerase/dehydratase family protein, partial [Caldisphaera sp.]